MKDKLNLKSFKMSITLKNKLLLAFLFVGIIPSLFIGFLLYYKSDEMIDKLIYSNMYDRISFINCNIHHADKFETDDSITILVENENYTNVNKKYLDYINKIDKEDYYDQYKKIKIIEIDDILCGSIYNEEKDYKIYHFQYMIKIHPFMDNIGTMFIKISLIIITLSIGFSLGLSYDITHGIIKLINYIKKVEKGDFNFQIDVYKNDEIGFLTKSFNKMTFRLNELINKTYKLELSENEARLKALQAQISPHFLYNALDTINWSLIEKEDYETSKILGSLSEILRYSIDYNKKLVKISDEFRQLENYLRIQKGRFEDRFDYEIYLDEQFKDYCIPKLLLQPLVENAVIHGVEKCHSGGKIIVNCEMYYDDILITINDNGNGITPDKLNKLKNKLNGNKKEKKDHIGLLNVNDRIKLLYGDNYYLDIDSNSNGTIAKLLIGKIDEVT